jgi:hypothetical protein
MKRWTMAAIPVVLLAMAGTYAVFAQQEAQTPPASPPSGMGMMGQPGQMHGCAMCGMMTGAMMWKTMTATSDGGVVVAVGNRLIKYDNQLNVVKDTEMKIDTSQMFSSVQKMMENCPMCKAMQQQSQPQAQARQ